MMNTNITFITQISIFLYLLSTCHFNGFLLFLIPHSIYLNISVNLPFYSSALSFSSLFLSLPLSLSLSLFVSHLLSCEDPFSPTLFIGSLFYLCLYLFFFTFNNYVNITLIWFLSINLHLGFSNYIPYISYN